MYTFDYYSGKCSQESGKNVTLYLFTYEIQVNIQVLLSAIQNIGVPLKAANVLTNRAHTSCLRISLHRVNGIITESNERFRISTGSCWAATLNSDLQRNRSPVQNFFLTSLP